MRKMHIKRLYYDAIMSGLKTLEVRVGYNSIKHLKAGDAGNRALATGRAAGEKQRRGALSPSKDLPTLQGAPWCSRYRD